MRQGSPLPIAACVVLLPLLAQAQGAPATQPSAPPDGAVLRLPGVKSFTAGGQYRLRYENQIDFDFDRNAGISEDFFTQRFRFHVNIEFTDEWSAMLQLQDAREWGEEASTLDDSADGLDLHQGWLQLRGFPGLGGTAKIGRQELQYGEERLVGNLDWRTQARAFDGLRWTWGDALATNWQLFVTQTREIQSSGAYDDAWFGGIYGTWKRERVQGEGYFLYLHNEQAAVATTEQRGTLGTRWIWNCSDAFELGTELVTQFGDLGDTDIPILETYAAHAHARWNLTAQGWKPWLQVDGNLASGNEPGGNENERFEALFPTAHRHQGDMDLAEWENLREVAVKVGAHPGKSTKLYLAGHRFWAMEEADSFGGPNGTLSTGALGQSRDMGFEVDMRLTQTFEAGSFRPVLEVGYAFFVPGSGTEQSKGSGDVAHFVYVQGNFPF